MTSSATTHVSSGIVAPLSLRANRSLYGAAATGSGSPGQPCSTSRRLRRAAEDSSSCLAPVPPPASRFAITRADASEAVPSGARAPPRGAHVELARLDGELKTIDQALPEPQAQPARAEPIELDRVRQALRRIDPLWDVLFPAERERIVRLLVEDIIVTTSGIDIRFRTNGIEQIVNEVQPREVVGA